jgi:hypothetical protein
MFELLAYYTSIILYIIQIAITVVIPALIVLAITMKLVEYLARVVVEEIE